jgi:hypothetical protein
MERLKQTVINRSVRDAAGNGEGRAPRRSADWPGGEGTRELSRAEGPRSNSGREAVRALAGNTASTVQPRDAGHYACSCETGPTLLDIPPELQLFAADRQGRNRLASLSAPEGAPSGSRGLSPDRMERPPPAPG